MREIKFRGWNSKHKKRIYGDLFRSRGEWFITQDGIVDNPLAEPEDWRVEPETVGQFTGLLDKNGKEMYERDIVQWNNNPLLLEIKWLEEELCFNTRNLLLNGFQEEITIIGNIYENPELINR